MARWVWVAAAFVVALALLVVRWAGSGAELARAEAGERASSAEPASSADPMLVVGGPPPARGPSRGEPASSGADERVEAGGDVEALVRWVVVDERGEAVRAIVATLRRCDEDANPLPDAPVRTLELSDPEGSYSCSGPAEGWVGLTVQAAGHWDPLTSLHRIGLPQERPFGVVLRRSVRVAGTVVDDDGAPVGGAAVRLSSSRFSIEEESAADGAFAFDGVPDGDARVEAGTDDGRALVWLSLAPGESHDDLELRLARDGRIEGRVLDAAGRPAEGREVEWGPAEPPRQPAKRRTRGSVRTRDDGTFRSDPVPAGDYLVIAFALREDIRRRAEELGGDDEGAMLDLSRSATVTVEPGGVARVDFRESAGGGPILTGTLHHRGEPAADWRVWVLLEATPAIGGARGVRTGPDGGFELSLPSPGDYLVLVAWSEDSEQLACVERLSVGPQGADVRLEAPAGELVVRPLDGQGRPWSGTVEVELERTGDLLGGRRQRGQGEIAFGLLPPGVYTLRAAADPPTAAARRVESLVLGAGEERVVDLRLDGGGSVSGVVRDAEGEPVAEAAVYARSADGGLLSHRPLAFTDGLGRYVLAGLPEGPVALLARSERAASAETVVVVRAGEASLRDLELVPGTRLEVRCVDAAGDPAPGSVRVLDGAGREVGPLETRDFLSRLLSAGHVTTRHEAGPLPPGHYRVVARDAGGGRRGEVTVLLDGEPRRELVVELR